MAIIYVPTSDYASSAASAATIDSIDLGNIFAGRSQSGYFRIGNLGTDAVSVTLTTDDASASLSVDSVTIQPDGFSDTLGVTVSVPLDAISEGGTAHIVVTEPDGSQTSLIASYAVLGANVERGGQSERTGDYSDKVAEILASLGGTIRLWTFSPVAFDAADTSVYVNNGKVIRQADCCSRLNPSNEDWGYVADVSTVIGVFQEESWESTAQFSRDQTECEYWGSAVLFLAAGYELPREWALFAPESGSDRTQYKRSVFLMKRAGQIWVLWSIIPIFRGEELAYWTAHLRPLEISTNGSIKGFNPFSQTYEYESDKPYQVFHCNPELVLTDPTFGS